MRLVRIIGAVITTGAAAFLGACSSSHDSFGAANANPPGTPVSTADAGAPHSGTVEFDRPPTSDQAPGARGTANPVDRAVRPLTLFGQLPNAGPVRAGVLDSPDNLTHVTFAFEGSDFDPAIDPTAQWLAYASTQHRQTSDIYIKRVNGSTVTQLTNDTGNHVMPVFSPDGKRIAFASDRGGSFAIYIMDAGGGQAVQLTTDANDNIHPSFSHDGKQLVYCSHGGQSGQWEMVVIDLDNPASKHFIGPGLFPSFSPVDNHVLFQRARERGTRWFSIWTIELVNGEGMRPTEIAASANAALITPAWSPDGKHIAFCTVLDPTTDDKARPVQADIWIIGSDGTGRSNLTHSPFANLEPVWAHDGTIYFSSNRGKDGTENIWSIRPDRAMQAVDRPDVNVAAGAGSTPSGEAGAIAHATPAPPPMTATGSSSASAAAGHAAAPSSAPTSGANVNASATAGSGTPEAPAGDQPAAKSHGATSSAPDSSAMVPTE